MKKKSFLVALFSVAIIFANAQNNKSTWGFSGGLIFPMDGFSIDQTTQNINSVFSSSTNSNGWYAGVFGRAYANKSLFAYGNLSYLHTDYYLQAVNEGANIKGSLNKSGAQLGAGLGIEMFNFLRVQGGVNGLAHFNQDWNKSFETFGAGYSFGAGVDIWKLTVDLTYNSSFKENSGEWKGVPLSHKRSDLMLGIGFKF